MGPTILVAVAVGSLILSAYGVFKSTQSEKNKATAEMLDSLSESMTTEIKRCNDDCKYLREENHQLRTDNNLIRGELLDVRRQSEIERQELKAEIVKLRLQLGITDA